MFLRIKQTASDCGKKLQAILSEALSSFMRNNDLTAASSLAFSAMLALIPTLFLLTYLLSMAIGSSTQALARTQEMMTKLLPAYSQDIIREVRGLAAHKGTFGLVNFVVLFWSMTPFVADMRLILGTVFRRKPDRPFLMEKLFDVAVSIVFLAGLSMVAVAGVTLRFLEKASTLHLIPGFVQDIAPLFFVSGVVFLCYLAFAPRMRIRYLVSGALATSLIWFAMRPAFHLFLEYNPGYGFAFGSFKSLFVVIIWIYASLVIFLIGAEIAESLNRNETVFLMRLVDGGRTVPASVLQKYVVRYQRGSVIFHEGDAGGAMFSVLTGRVGICKNDTVIAEIPAGRYFGEMSFLLAAPRVATACALDDVELVTINSENINNLMNEFPEFVVKMLKEMAMRLRDTDKLID